MQLLANIRSNGSTITLGVGDTLVVTLRYGTGETSRTQWIFRDNFDFNCCLNLGAMAVENGVRSMEFAAHSEGAVEIVLFEEYVLGLPDSSGTGKSFRLKVNVVQRDGRTS